MIYATSMILFLIVVAIAEFWGYKKYAEGYDNGYEDGYNSVYQKKMKGVKNAVK